MKSETIFAMDDEINRLRKIIREKDKEIEKLKQKMSAVRANFLNAMDQVHKLNNQIARNYRQ